MEYSEYVEKYDITIKFEPISFFPSGTLKPEFQEVGEDGRKLVGFGSLVSLGIKFSDLPKELQDQLYDFVLKSYLEMRAKHG